MISIKTLIKFIFIDLRYILALGVRVFVVILTEILYAKFNVVYTDIDYHVFSDGARHLLNYESPYERETYRYTPLLAMMMIPNHLINYNWGKLLLCFIDVLVGALIELLLNLQNKPTDKQILQEQEKEVNYVNLVLKYLNNPYAYTGLIYLYNPITINICTRGSADCIVSFLILLTLIIIELKQYALAGIVYGFAVHFKIYPIIYAPAIYLNLVSRFYKIDFIKNDSVQEKDLQSSKIQSFFTISKNFIRKIFILTKATLKSLVNIHTIGFVLLSTCTFISFLVGFYAILGNKFLHEYLLYHIIRKDHRHNFSLFYYIIYLTYDSHLSKLISLVTFLPQALLIFISSLFLFHDINLCLLILTLIFVTFNKVITAQYFLWYISLIPLIVPFNNLFSTKKIKGISIVIILIVLDLGWVYLSHLTEYKGHSYFLEMWGVNVLFFLFSCYLIKEILISHNK